MNLLDKIVASVTPEPSDEDIVAARTAARMLARDTGWLALVLDHHEQIDEAFVAVLGASSASAQRAAQKRLALLLTGHSMAEEAVLYPAMALSDQEGHAGSAYTQQSSAKVQLAALEDLEPLSPDYMDKLEHLRVAVTHHVHQEESKWFPNLRQQANATLQAKLTRRYTEEFSRYMGAGTK